MNTFELNKHNIILRIDLDGEIIVNASSNKNDEISKLFCSILLNMDIVNAIYYAAKITLEKISSIDNRISFVHHHELLNNYDQLLKELYTKLTNNEVFRFEDIYLKKWNSKSKDEQIEQINKYLNEYFNEEVNYPELGILINIHNNKFEIDLSKITEKENYQQTLVEIEKYLRKKLNNIPIILTVEEEKDANRKRK